MAEMSTNGLLSEDAETSLQGIVFPLPEGDMLLDLDFDFESTDFLDAALGLQDPARETILDQQYGAVAALATQGAVVRPVLTPSQPGTDHIFQQDWHRWDPSQQVGDPLGLPDLLLPSASQTLSQSLPADFPSPFDFSNGPIFDKSLDFGGLTGLQQHAQLPQEESSRQRSTRQRTVKHEPDVGMLGTVGSHDSGSSGSGDLTAHQEKSEAEIRAEKTKLKNKRAQKKFRQKQKDKHEELERSAAELSQRLKRVLAEKEALENQKKVLEIALTRNSSNNVASTTPALLEAEEEPVFVPAKGFERFSSKSGILLEVLFDPPRKLSHEQAIRLSLKDHARIWKEVCRQAGELLASGEEDINSPKGRKLRALLNERHGLLAWTSVNNPVIMHKLMTSKLVDPPIQDMETPGPDFWHRILVSMKLSEEQKRSLLTARNTYLTEVGRLLEERRRLQGILRGLDTGFKSALGDKARTHVLWAEAVRALQENVDAFHICHCVFMVSVFNRQGGFSVFQEAKLLVQSFPHAPDVFALLKELASMAGEPPAPVILKEGAASSLLPVIPTRAVDAEQEPYVSLEMKMESAITGAKLGNFIERLV